MSLCFESVRAGGGTEGRTSFCHGIASRFIWVWSPVHHQKGSVLVCVYVCAYLGVRPHGRIWGEGPGLHWRGILCGMACLLLESLS